jgi:hypothetical protein
LKSSCARPGGQKSAVNAGRARGQVSLAVRPSEQCTGRNFNSDGEANAGILDAMREPLTAPGKFMGAMV